MHRLGQLISKIPSDGNFLFSIKNELYTINSSNNIKNIRKNTFKNINIDGEIIDICTYLGKLYILKKDKIQVLNIEAD